MDMLKQAKQISQNALRMGKYELDGKRFEEFEIELLRVGDGNLVEHVDNQASGMLYYDILAELVRVELLNKEIEYKNWYSRRYEKARLRLLEEEGKKPNISDVENRVKGDYPKGYKEWNDIINEYKSAQNVINIWANAFKQKSFSMNIIAGEDFEKITAGRKEYARKVLEKYSKR